RGRRDRMGQRGPGQQRVRLGEPDGQCHDPRPRCAADDRPQLEGAPKRSAGAAERTRRTAAAQKRAEGTAGPAEGCEEMSRAACQRRVSSRLCFAAALGTVACLLLGSAPTLVRSAEPAATEKAGTAFPYEMLISGLERPIRVRFSVTVNGKPWLQNFEDVQRRYRQALFAQLDADPDGKLSPAEARRSSPPPARAAVPGGGDLPHALPF